MKNSSKIQARIFRMFFSSEDYAETCGMREVCVGKLLIELGITKTQGKAERESAHVLVKR